MQLSQDMQDEISPKNLLMIGPTGVGKTEIARRLAKIVNAPFVKVEATKFTEVGYVGGDVESMVRDLVENAIQLEREDEYKQVHVEAEKRANNKLVKLLVPAEKKKKNQNEMQNLMSMFSRMQQGQMPSQETDDQENVTDDVREKRMSVAEKLRSGLLENDQVEIEMADPSQQLSGQNTMLNQMGIDLNDTLSGLMPKKTIKRTVPVSEARTILTRQASEELINKADLYHNAITRAENTGIIFIDEIDKIAPGNSKNSGEVSREGVQRDILPIVEGSQVNTKYGPVNTDHMLFIGSGAFAESKPSDLIPELQGRFPIRLN